MSGSPSTGGSNPRKFSEKIALHNQKQAEETRAFEQLMTDLTVSRVRRCVLSVVPYTKVFLVFPPPGRSLSWSICGLLHFVSSETLLVFNNYFVCPHMHLFSSDDKPQVNHKLSNHE